MLKLNSSCVKSPYIRVNPSDVHEDDLYSLSLAATTEDWARSNQGHVFRSHDRYLKTLNRRGSEVPVFPIGHDVAGQSHTGKIEGFNQSISFTTNHIP